MIGTGAWGTTFAQVLADAGRDVTMWGRNPDVVADIARGRNPRYFPDRDLNPTIRATTDAHLALADAELTVIALPTQTIRTALTQLPIASPVLTLSKGIEHDSFTLVTDIIAEVLGIDAAQIAALSGPNLAREIADQHPTATTVASTNDALACDIAQACHNDYFRPYVSHDVVGTEIAGAVKNVIAIAVGASEGLGYGANTRTTIITRGLAEMTRYGIARGAQPTTFSGLSGIGDLVATCSSRLSRNYSFGYRLGQGWSCDDAFAASTGVVEGALTAAPLVADADARGIDMPISRGVATIVSGRASVVEMAKALLSRPRKMDGWEIRIVE